MHYQNKKNIIMDNEELKYCYKYPHPSVTTDCVIFGFDGTRLNVLLVQRGVEPFEGCWALPGGFLRMDEDAATGALRELREETGAVGGRLVPLGDLYPSVGICDEVIHMYAAVGFDLGSTDPDDDEFLRTRPVALGTLVDMIMNGEVTDAKTQAAVLKTARLRDMGKL